MIAPSRRRAGVPASVLLLLCGCAANRNLVVVLPESDGHVGAVVVQAGGSNTLLNTSYAAAAPSARAAHPLRPGSLDNPKIKQIFGDTLAALPEAPITEKLYFESGSLEMTPDSAAKLQALLDGLKARKAVEIVLTGHTDTKGTDDFNDALSLQRAQSVRDKLAPTLAQYGISDDSIKVAGRGKRELLVKTPDDTAEPLNRRVEITVR